MAALPLCLFRPKNPENGRWYARQLSRGAFRILNVDLEVRHPERLEADEPSIYVVNHQHLLDMFVFGDYFPSRAVTMGKKDLKWIPVFGWIYYYSGQFLLDRGDRGRAYATLDLAARKMKDNGLSVLICPEGTRSQGGPMGPFKRGAFYLAITHGFPLRPWAVSSYHKTLHLGRWHGGKIVVHVFEPFSTKGLTEADIDRVQQELHDRIEAKVAQLDAEIIGTGLPTRSA